MDKAKQKHHDWKYVGIYADEGITGTPEYMKPLNVGLMFFNDEPQKFFPYNNKNH